MANITLVGLQPGTAVVSVDTTKTQATTATSFVNPTLSSIIRVTQNTPTYKNFNISNLDSPVTGNRSSTPGVLTGRRPIYGQLFPRGYFNK